MTRLGLLNFGLRHIARPFLARTKSPERAERDFIRAARFVFRVPKGLKFSTDYLALSEPKRELPISRITMGDADDTAAILYMHGGGYVAGSAWTHRGMLATFSRLSGTPVYAPDYRLAHHTPFPAAFDDAVSAWHVLRTVHKLPAERILLAGDSAGGGLALALLAHVLNEGETPAGLIGFSPWTDLTLASPSIETNEATDAILVAARMPELCDIVLAGADPADPRVSPLHAQWTMPPPVYLQASATEILCDDTRRMADVLRAAGGEASVDIWPDAPHVWQIFDGWVPEALEALKKAAEFARARLTPPSQAGN
ncbi:MAG: alpha/beta hydrolase fold domain-containing protein [Silicimonas sp.]|nr:alpha/beta hydrolase fold domain-containing protein [Silicimonas sp.]